VPLPARRTTDTTTITHHLRLHQRLRTLPLRAPLRLSYLCRERVVGVAAGWLLGRWF